MVYIYDIYAYIHVLFYLPAVQVFSDKSNVGLSVYIFTTVRLFFSLFRAFEVDWGDF